MYTIYQIMPECEITVLETDDIETARRAYWKTRNARLMVDGYKLPIWAADKAMWDKRLDLENLMSRVRHGNDNQHARRMDA